MKLLCPAYFDTFLKACLIAAENGHGHKLAVILNPDSGPGKTKNVFLASAKEKLQAAGAEVWAYVDAVAGKGYSAVVDAQGRWSTPDKPRAKTSEELGREKARHELFYHEFTGFFIDDATTNEHLGASRNAFKDRSLFWNPGNPGDARKFDLVGHRVCVWESENYAKRYSGLPCVRAKAAVLSLQDTDWKSSLQTAKSRGVDYFLATDVKGDPWRAAPSFFPALVTSLP